VRQEVTACYGTNGQVSVDPVIILKMLLLLFLDDVRSERELVRMIPLRIDYLWFLGYGLEDVVPNYSVLSKARQRWGGEVFERLFARTIEQCVAAGLVAGDKLYVDSSLVRANAARGAVVAVVREQVAKLEQVNEHYVNATDPDSTVVRHTTGRPTPSYKNHWVLDDRAGVITALQSTTGIVDDGAPLDALVKQHEQRTGQSARTIVADAKYGTTANFLALQQQGKITHLADLRDKLDNPRAHGIYPPARFAYEAQTDCYTCPAGQMIKRHHFHARRGYYEYRPAKGTCAACQLKPHCTRDQAGRSLKRYLGQALIDRGRAQSRSEAGQQKP
jgi:transposase